jgi:hypothetical protein
MPCEHVKLGEGAFAIICSRRGRGRAVPCVGCGGRAGRLCDGPGKRANTTCSAPLCARCSSSRPDGKGDTVDLCPKHKTQQALNFGAFP